MITLEQIKCPAVIVRLIPGDDHGPYPKFVASGVLEMNQQAPHIGTMKALIGSMTPALKRELVSKLRDIGITDLRSIRADGHHLPCSVLLEDGFLTTDLIELERRLFRGAPHLIAHRKTP